MADADYSGTEPTVGLANAMNVEPDSVFEVRAPKLPVGAVPVFDESLKAVVGYRHEITTGVYRLYDLNGALVGMEEKGLESPTVDPIDLIFFFGGVFRAFGKGVIRGVIRKTPRIAATTAGRLSARLLLAAVAGAMRTAFKGLFVRELKFTATTAARMTAKGRYVPLHILHLAIKFGERAPDPQGVKGAFVYTIKMLRNGEESPHGRLARNRLDRSAFPLQVMAVVDSKRVLHV